MNAGVPWDRGRIFKRTMWVIVFKVLTVGYSFYDDKEGPIKEIELFDK
jgi:hypothetical protein